MLSAGDKVKFRHPSSAKNPETKRVLKGFRSVYGDDSLTVLRPLSEEHIVLKDSHGKMVPTSVGGYLHASLVEPCK
jgi:hypothetical protein